MTFDDQILDRLAPATSWEPDWRDVLGRAGVRPRRRLLRSILEPAPQHRQRPRRSLLVVALALLVAVLIATPLVGARILDLFWADGTPVKTSALGAQDRWLLKHLGAGGGPSIEEIASDGRLTFYVIRGQEGRMCVASGPSGRSPTVASSACMAASDLRKVLPTPEHPLYAETGAILDPSTRKSTITRVIGLANTPVTRVELLAADGHLVASAPVEDHVFELLGVSVAPPVALRAVGERGNRIYEKQIP